MKFVGSYPNTIKSVFIASALSGNNAMVVSPPGWGKTEMALQGASKVSGGNEGVIFLELEPSSPPELVKGTYDPAQVLQGKMVKLLDNTPYDPRARVVILDELWRSNDIVFDALVHATNNKQVDPFTKPVFWATSNFVGKSERTEALRDRFAFWLHIEPDSLSAKDVMKSHINNGHTSDEGWANDFPSWDECVKIRQSQISDDAAECVCILGEQLAAEAEKEKFIVNPRRLTQWTEILARLSVYYSGTTSFTTVPMEASKILRYAYPCVDATTSIRWQKVAAAVSDVVGTAIEEYKAMALNKFEDVVKASSSSDRTRLVTDLGVALAEAQTTLQTVGGKDPRVATVCQELTDWFAKAVSGK